MDDKQKLFSKIMRPEVQRKVRLSLAALVLMVLGSVGLDQISKIQAEASLMVWSDPQNLNLYQGRRVPLVSLGSDIHEPHKPYLSLSLNYVRNLGAAWGALSNLDDAIRVPFFYGVTIFAVIFIFFYMKSTPPHHRLARFGLGLILSGAIGNFLDRLRIGYVIDWIDVRWNVLGWRYDFPNFNLADSAITVGLSLLIFDMIFFEGRRRRREQEFFAESTLNQENI